MGRGIAYNFILNGKMITTDEYQLTIIVTAGNAKPIEEIIKISFIFFICLILYQQNQYVKFLLILFNFF